VFQWIVDGYSTMLREIDQQLEDDVASAIVTPVGVGSLAQAVVLHSKSAGRSTSVLTVEPDTAACLKRSLEVGSITQIATRHTIMSGMNCGTVSYSAWPIHKSGVDASVTVSDFEAHEAVQYLQKAGVNAGPCGAASLAALRHVAKANLEAIGLNANSVVVLLCTEGAREYQIPRNVSTDDPAALTQTLVQIDSSNPGWGTTPGAGETEIANYIAAWLEHRDISVHWIEEVLGRPSVVGVLKGSGGGKTLMFNGHIDTVTNAGYDGDPLGGNIENGAVQGRGSVDMKAGIAASMVAMARAKQSQLRGDIILAAVADEENLSIGTEQVLKAGWRADGAVVAEPSLLDIILSHKGFVWLEVDILGTASHGSRPDLGVDAITRAGYFLVELDKHSRSLLKGKPHPSLQSTGSIHASLIAGGEEPSSYPAKCTITIERRTVPGETPETVEQEIRSILSSIAQRVPGYKYGVRVTFSRSPFEVPQGHPFVQTVLKNVESVLGRKPKVRPEAAWTDCALLAEKGIPALLFGPDGEGLHAMREWATVDSIEKVTDALERIAVEFCG
jgi:acetylornithine deacetylase/succinyl-diaminopimelate desuccinylase family protein